MPVVDGHNDLPWAIRTKAGGSLVSADPRQDLTDFHTDIRRLRDGGVGGQFWSVFVPGTDPQPFRTTLEQIGLVRQMVELASEDFELATTAADVAASRDAGRIACLMGAEGGHCIEDSLDNLRALFEQGVRYLTLTHGNTIGWADSATDAPRHGGLSGFGRDVVREMNRLGMLVDISHVSPATMRDALEVSSAPVIASHSNAYALAPHSRNLPDDVLRALVASAGVAMVNFYPAFLVDSTARRAQQLISDRPELWTRFGTDEAVQIEAEMAEERKTWELGSVRDVADHIEYIAAVAGVDHVGIGSDFDGMDLAPHGLTDVSCYPRLTEELVRRGWPEHDIRKVLGANILRALADAERVAA